MKKILTILSSLTATSVTASLTIACNGLKSNNKVENVEDDKNNESTLDLSTINANIILNYDGFLPEDKEPITKVNMASKTQEQIAKLLKLRITNIMLYQIIGMKEADFEEAKKDKNISEKFAKKADAFQKLLLNGIIKVEVNPVKNDEFIATIKVKKWDDVNYDILIGDAESMKASYDSIKGKKQEEIKINITLA